MIDKQVFEPVALKCDKILGFIAALSVFCLIFVLAHKALFDYDIWLHLKSGEFILQNKFIPTYDIFSFTLKDKPWVDHEWLFQIIAYLVYSKWQVEGLISLQCYTLLTSFLLLFFMGYRQMRSYLEAAVLVFALGYACVTRFNIRPDIFSMAFFIIFLYLIRFHLDKKRIWLLAPIQILWVNIHGYFFLGPLLAMLFIIAEFTRRRLKSLPWQWKEQFILDDFTYNRLQKLFFCLCSVCLINPRGLAGALYPLSVFIETLLGQNKIFFKHIQELQPTLQQHHQLGNLFFIVAGACFLLLIVNIKKLKLAEILLVAFFSLFALSKRNITFFAVVSYMVVASYLGQIARNISERIRQEPVLRQAVYFLLRYGIAIFLIIWVYLRVNLLLGQGEYNFKANKFSSVLFGIDESRYPKEAVDFIVENNIKANWFNDFNSGAYLIGTAYPLVQVFIDGRTELYGQEFFKQYQFFMKADRKAFAAIVNKYDITAILLSLTSSTVPDVAKCIYNNPEWKLAFFNETGIIFLKDVSANKDIIARYAIDLKSYLTLAVDIKALGIKRVYPHAFIKRALLFSSLGEEDLVIQEAKEALRILPNSSRAYELLGKAYLAKGLYNEALENLRSALLLAPDRLEALTAIGSCLRELNEDKSALAALKSAIKINKRYPSAYYELAKLYLKMDNKKQALEALNKGIKYDPKNSAYHFKLAEALYEIALATNNSVYFTRSKKALDQAVEFNLGCDEELSNNIDGLTKFLLQFTGVYDKNKQ